MLLSLVVHSGPVRTALNGTVSGTADEGAPLVLFLNVPPDPARLRFAQSFRCTPNPGLAAGRPRGGAVTARRQASDVVRPGLPAQLRSGTCGQPWLVPRLQEGKGRFWIASRTTDPLRSWRKTSNHGWLTVVPERIDEQGHSIYPSCQLHRHRNNLLLLRAVVSLGGLLRWHPSHLLQFSWDRHRQRRQPERRVGPSSATDAAPQAPSPMRRSRTPPATRTPFEATALGGGKSAKVRTGKGSKAATNRYQGRSWYVWNNDKDTAYPLAHRDRLDSCSYNNGSASSGSCLTEDSVDLYSGLFRKTWSDVAGA